MVTQLRTAIDGSLGDTLATIKQSGDTLAQPDVWDGTLASDFRSNTWPAVVSALNNMQTQLGNLHQKLNSIQTNIQEAGGNT
jgi:uncharacterized protein YukE